MIGSLQKSPKRNPPQAYHPTTEKLFFSTSTKAFTDHMPAHVLWSEKLLDKVFSGQLLSKTHVN
jgi:hypothetical protein